MSVLDRAALEASPLADLHAIASELSMDGYRRLRKADLIDAIIARQDGEEPATTEEAPPAQEEAAAEQESTDEETTTPARRRRGRRGGRGRGSAAREEAAEATEQETPAPEPQAEEQAPAKSDRDEIVEGVVDLLPNGSGFVRVSPPDPSDADVYISAAQVKRCELVSGDVVAGPRRAPQRSERFASLLRIDTINGNPAADVADRGRFDDLPVGFPTERFSLGADDPTLNVIELLTPFGRGSRVVITGGPWAGKSHALRQLALALAGADNVTLLVALAGVRPEELPEWEQIEGLPAPAAATSFAASSDAQDHAVELAIEQARRVAARGGDAVVLIDTLDGLHPLGARKALAAARKLVDGGSLTVIATSSRTLGGETTVIALDRELTAAGRFPALDLALSGTLRAELLVGEEGARAIAEARAQALAQ